MRIRIVTGVVLAVLLTLAFQGRTAPDMASSYDRCVTALESAHVRQDVCRGLLTYPMDGPTLEGGGTEDLVVSLPSGESVTLTSTGDIITSDGSGWMGVLPAWLVD